MVWKTQRSPLAKRSNDFKVVKISQQKQPIKSFAMKNPMSLCIKNQDGLKSHSEQEKESQRDEDREGSIKERRRMSRMDVLIVLGLLGSIGCIVGSQWLSPPVVCEGSKTVGLQNK